MIITPKNIDRCFISTFDADQNQIMDLTSINTDDFTGTQHARDDNGKLVINDAGDAVVTRNIQLKTPVLMKCKFCQQDIFRHDKSDCSYCVRREKSIRQDNQK